MEGYESGNVSNSVNGSCASNDTNVSLGHKCYVRQVTLDHDRESVRSSESQKVATWNVRMLYQTGKMKNET